MKSGMVSRNETNRPRIIAPVMMYTHIALSRLLRKNGYMKIRAGKNTSQEINEIAYV